MQGNCDFMVDTEWSHRRGCLWDWYLDKGPYECPSGAVTYKSGPVVELSVKTVARERIFQIFPLKLLGLCATANNNKQVDNALLKSKHNLQRNE